MYCFNPYRVFKFVATLKGEDEAASERMFQSLSGFQVRCNKSLPLHPGNHRMVSIPIGFSSSLQHRHLSRINPQRKRFQSLSGFQVRCNDIAQGSWPAPQFGFNPYRVFKFVATVFRMVTKTQEEKFQSLSGFQVRCNGWRMRKSSRGC